MAQKKTVQVIKVAARSNERKGNTGQPGNLGVIKTVSAVFGTHKKKAELGKQGLMLVEDWESKNFAPYKLTNTDILFQAKGSSVADTQINALAEENQRLQQEIERLTKGLSQTPAGNGNDAADNVATMPYVPTDIQGTEQKPTRGRKKGENNNG